MGAIQELLKEAEEMRQTKNRLQMELDLFDTRQEQWIAKIKEELKRRDE